MASYSFSALSNGQAISFNPSADVLNFDQAAISAANLGVTVEGSNLRISVLSGADAGKSVVLQGTSPLQLATSNVTFANGSALLFGDNSPGTANDNAGNVLSGTAGSDLLQGFGGADTMNGSAGNDTYIVGSGDVLSDSGGIDTVVADISWNLGAAFENLTLTGSSSTSNDGNELANTIVGNAGANNIHANGGADTVMGGAGNDTVGGGAGNDWLEGGLGNDTLGGGGDRDHFAFREAGAANADVMSDFSSNWDDIQLDLAAFGALGTSGRFASGDVRFYSAAGATAGHDADDRIVFNTTTHQLFYDADGSGSGASQLIATLANGANITATDIFAFGTPGGGGGGNQTITGTSGADSLAGGSGNDTISGLGGNDTLDGLAGSDMLNGGSANDSLTGGTGNDVFAFAATGTANADTVVDFVSGTDKIQLDASVMGALGAAGNFTADDPRFYAAPGAMFNHDADDVIIYDTNTGALRYYAESGISRPSGDPQLIATLAGAPTLLATDIAVVGQSDKHLVGTSGDDSLVGGDGNDTLEGLAGNDTLNGGADGNGRDSLVGGAGDDSLWGGYRADAFVGGDGNDTLDGLNHHFAETDPDTETLDGGAGDDVFVIDNPGDVIIDAGGVDTLVVHNMPWTLGAGFENLVINNGETEATDSFFGNSLANIMDGGQGGWNFIFHGGAGNDTLIGDGHNATLIGDDGDDVLTELFPTHLTMTGGAGGDSFGFTNLFSDANITDFASGLDKIHLDAQAMTELGTTGNFAAGDPRFFAAAGAMGGHDADDRVIYDTTFGNLYYDPDGSGAQNAALITVVRSGGSPATVVATDIVVDNGSAPPPPDGSINGTEGNDTIDGTSGSDTINGLGGNDTINASDGDDTVRGGTGNDTLSGNNGTDWVEGNAGNDTVGGGGGKDVFAFHEYGAANADTLVAFAGSNWDSIRFDEAAFTELGATGRFASGDARFFSGAGVTAAHDATDRIVYDTSTGNLYYDHDGSGGDAAQLVATLQGAPTLLAADLWAF